MKILINQKQLQILVEQTTNEPKIYNRPNDPYEYKFENGKWFGRKKGTNGNFLDLSKYQKSIDILNKEFPQNQNEKPKPEWQKFKDKIESDQQGTQQKVAQQQGTQQKVAQQQGTQQKGTTNVDKNNLGDVIAKSGYGANTAEYKIAYSIGSHEGWNGKANGGKGTRSYRNNNPGNLSAKAIGEFKTIDPNVGVEPEGVYAKFSSPELGAKALIQNKIIRWANGKMPITAGNQQMIDSAKGGEKYVKGQKPTVAQFFYTYAPPNENNTESYIKGFLASFPGKDRNTPMINLLSGGVS